MPSPGRFCSPAGSSATRPVWRWVVDRIGAGDSFVAGLIHGLLDGDLDLAIRLGGFAAAIGLATPGDINYLGLEDLGRFHANRVGGLEPYRPPISLNPPSTFPLTTAPQ